MRNFCLQIIWVDPDACRLLANNLGSRHLILSVNLDPKIAMFAGRAPAMCRSLQVSITGQQGKRD